VCIIRVSKSGNLITSGETQAAGIQSAIIVWDFKDRDMLYRVRYHIELIQGLDFNCDERYMISLGGMKDGNKVACWNMQEGASEVVQPGST
jgi:hypothetical protein